MNNPFKQTGFDSTIGKGVDIHGNITVPQGSVLRIDGKVSGGHIAPSAPRDENIKSSDKTTIFISGDVLSEMVSIPNLTVTGSLRCKTLIVTGILAIKKGAVVRCDKIKYRNLVAETGAIIVGEMEYLDHVPVININEEE